MSDFNALCTQIPWFKDISSNNATWSWNHLWPFAKTQTETDTYFPIPIDRIVSKICYYLWQKTCVTFPQLLRQCIQISQPSHANRPSQNCCDSATNQVVYLRYGQRCVQVFLCHQGYNDILILQTRPWIMTNWTWKPKEDGDFAFWKLFSYSGSTFLRFWLYM